MSAALQAPMLHTGGTSRAVLLDGYCSAREAVQRALTATEEHGPNQRDYYPLSPEAWGRAVAQHRARLAALMRVREELTELVDAIDAGGATQ